MTVSFDQYGTALENSNISEWGPQQKIEFFFREFEQERGIRKPLIPPSFFRLRLGVVLTCSVENLLDDIGDISFFAQDKVPSGELVNVFRSEGTECGFNLRNVRIEFN